MFRPHARDSRVRRAQFCARICARASLLPGILAVTACDIPTALPKWDATFVVQAEKTTLAVAQLLPASVTISNNEFAISASPVSFSEDLADLCASCTVSGSQAGSRPAFVGSFESSAGLPADVMAATLASGRLDVTLTNSLTFDPLRANSDSGRITISVQSGGRMIGSQVVTGATSALPPGAKMVVSVPVQGNVDEKMNVAVQLSAPADQNSTAPGGKLDVTVSPNELRASAARFAVQARHITAKPIELKLSDIEAGVRVRAQSGAVLLSVANPLGVSGTLTLRIAGGPRAISKSVALKAGNSEVEAPLDATELKSFLGYDVIMSLAGSVFATDPLVLTPAQEIAVSSRLKLTLGPRD